MQNGQLQVLYIEILSESARITRVHKWALFENTKFVMALRLTQKYSVLSLLVENESLTANYKLSANLCKKKRKKIDNKNYFICHIAAE